MNRENINDSYVGRIINLAIDVKYPSGKVLSKIKNIGFQYDYYGESLASAKNAIRLSNTTRRTTYLTLNPELVINDLYSGSFSIPEFARIAVTRLRTSSHRLKIESGRWARIPRDLRLCSCGEIQNEDHVLLRCPISQDLRSTFPLTANYGSASQLLNASYPDIVNIGYFCTKILDLYP